MIEMKGDMIGASRTDVCNRFTQLGRLSGMGLIGALFSGWDVFLGVTGQESMNGPVFSGIFTGIMCMVIIGAQIMMNFDRKEIELIQ